MRSFNWVFATAITVFAAACANPTQTKLEGRWIGESISNLEASQLAAAMGWVRGASFEFSGSNLTVAIPTELPRSGEYEIVSADDTQVVIAVQRPDGVSDSARLVFQGQDQLRWDIGQGREILMRRMN